MPNLGRASKSSYFERSRQSQSRPCSNTRSVKEFLDDQQIFSQRQNSRLKKMREEKESKENAFMATVKSNKSFFSRTTNTAKSQGRKAKVPKTAPQGE